MKKIILAAMLIITAFAQAQVEIYDGEVMLENNKTYTYNVKGAEAKMHFLVHNGTNATINVKLKMEEITNNDNGENVQFCYGGLCYNGVYEGITAPTGGPSDYTKVLAGGNSGLENYFYNNFGGNDETQPVIYKISIINIDSAGLQLGDPIITFTYRYDALASTTDFASLERMGIKVNKTIVNNTLDITANQNIKLELININGQSVKNATITNGYQSIDLSGLSSAVYFAKFTNEENKTAQIKIVKN